MSLKSHVDHDSTDDNDNDGARDLSLMIISKKCLSCQATVTASLIDLFVQSHLSICFKHAFPFFLFYFLQREFFLDVYAFKVKK